jgi:hypothetical protein
MTAVLLSLHVVAAIVFIGPITVSASVFPRYARGAVLGWSNDLAVAKAMHRISRGYAIPALAVPVFGIGTGAALGVLGQTWLVVSMVLTAIAAVLLVAVIVPGQRRLLTGVEPPPGGTPADPAVLRALVPRLGAFAGIFSTTWVVVVVLMIVRPGSTTGV